MTTKKPIFKLDIAIVGWIVFFLIMSITKAKSQNNPATKPPDTTGMAKYIDSLEQHTTIKQMQQFLFESVSARFYSEGKFVELYNWYLDRKINEWIQRKTKPKN